MEQGAIERERYSKMKAFESWGRTIGREGQIRGKVAVSLSFDACYPGAQVSRLADHHCRKPSLPAESDRRKNTWSKQLTAGSEAIVWDLHAAPFRYSVGLSHLTGWDVNEAVDIKSTPL